MAELGYELRTNRRGRKVKVTTGKTKTKAPTKLKGPTPKGNIVRGDGRGRLQRQKTGTANVTQSGQGKPGSAKVTQYPSGDIVKSPKGEIVESPGGELTHQRGYKTKKTPPDPSQVSGSVTEKPTQKVRRYSQEMLDKIEGYEQKGRGNTISGSAGGPNEQKTYKSKPDSGGPGSGPAIFDPATEKAAKDNIKKALRILGAITSTKGQFATMLAGSIVSDITNNPASPRSFEEDMKLSQQRELEYEGPLRQKVDY